MTRCQECRNLFSVGGTQVCDVLVTPISELGNGDGTMAFGADCPSFSSNVDPGCAGDLCSGCSTCEPCEDEP